MVSVGRYTLHGEIASGGMATVHFGRARAGNGQSRVVAIKCLRKDLARDPEFASMFLDEARLASRIRHPNVVPTIDVASDGTFLVMEYVAGESLAALMTASATRGEPVPIGITIRVITDLLRGLYAAHVAVDESGAALDIVHRDVSPQNLIVGSDGVARVLDFGIAKAAVNDHTTKEGRLKGKLRYMAPEQVKDAMVTSRTDIYSASVVLWELLTGEKLFTASNDAAILAQVLEGTVIPPSRVVPSVPKELDAIALRGLSREPALRFASALEMADTLERAVAPASARDVALWVDRIAGATIAKRAERVARIEQATNNVALSFDDTGASSPGMPTGTQTLERRDLAIVGAVPGATLIAPLQQPLPVALPARASRTGRGVRLGVLLFLGSSLVVFAASSAITRLRANAEASTIPIPVPSPVEPEAPPPQVAEAPAPAAVPTVPTPAAESAEPSEPVRPPAKPQVAHSPSKSPSHPHAKASVVPTAPAAPPPAAAAPSKPDCSQHYYVDPSGIRRAKPECL